MKTQVMAAATLLVCLAGCNSKPADTRAQDETDIKALEARVVAAIQAKDVNGIMANYAADSSLVVFDAVPPRQYVGAAAYRKDWEDTFSMFPGALEAGISDLDVTVGGDVAFARSIQQFNATDKSGKPMRLTVRVTDGLKKTDGKWLIAHEHVSIPVDLATMTPDPTSKP